jgi:hypoxanthine phosphoribosyltransferase
VRELAEEISADYAGKDVLLIGVLKGAVFFLADLMRQLEVDCEVDFMAVSSYGSSTDRRASCASSRTSTRRSRAGTSDRRGHRRLGLTLSYLFRMLGARSPASLEVCALLTKPDRREVDMPIRYVGFEIPNKFAIGYGLDHAERYRNLPYVAVLNES